jgi:pentatricopeptide repeat protein
MPPSSPSLRFLLFCRRPLAPHRHHCRRRRHSLSASVPAGASAIPPLSGDRTARLAAAIHGSTAAKNFAHAIRLTKSLVQASSSPGPRSGGGAAAFAALDSTSSTPAPALGVLVIALSQMTLLDEALSMFRRLRTLPALPVCNALLYGLLKARRFGCPFELFDEMLRRGMVPSVVTYNTLINACRHQGSMKKAWEVWNQMVERRIDPNVVTYTTMICILCEEDCIGDAERLFLAMKEEGMHPNLYTYNVVMSNCCQRDNVDHAYELYQELLESGLVPNSVIFTTLIDGFSKVKRFCEAKKCFLTCPDLGLFLLCLCTTV